MEELRFALGMKAGPATKERQLMKRFEKALPKMTGALLEIGQDKAVRPIHTSFLEFFAQMQETTASPASLYLQCDFKVDAGTVRHLVAIDYLSYLLFDAPKEPVVQLSLSLAHSTRGHLAKQAIYYRYPLLLYATGFWVSHATEAIQGGVIPLNQSIPADHYLHGLVLKYINNFMDNKLAVTIWIEASWFTGVPPSLDQLSSLVNTVQLPNHIKHLSERLAVFASELQQLNSRWSTILRDNPGEIWEPSISAFMKPKSWLSSYQATVTELDLPQTDAGQKGLEPSHDSTCILIASKSSSSGSEVGWIKVWPSKYFAENINSKEDPNLDEMSREWNVSYDIKRLVDGQSPHHIEVQLPEKSVLSIVKKARLNAGQFEFPVAFSHDLRQIIILNYLIRIHSSSTNALRQDFSVQSLEINQCSMQGQDGTALGPFPWYFLIFSPTARYIAVLGGPSKPGPQSNAYKERQILILEDRSENWQTPDFHVLATEDLVISPLAQTRYWAFHPFQTALVVACLDETNMWFFKHPVRWVCMPVRAPLDGLAFSNCGNYLHGVVCGNSRQLRMICFRKYFEERKTILSSSSREHGMEVAPVHQSEQLSLTRGKEMEMILTPESITFDNVEGRSQISMLRHLNDDGAVVLQKFRDDGTIQS
ncbi:hypothetical protein E0Z10_g4395 [Xylaria hypoxylon]|uniref:Uncharacterized protein n=1 Tax=Xylaria hypoxylon TaxID=37992 RepID=A0A4Z0YY35_9PEZI|nr:hypothetical protein E0Z10_g4395 [Xylaria hypoxylon]